MFHVSLLEPYHRRDGKTLLAPLAPILLKDSREKYEVEAILDTRLWRGKTQYLI